MDAFYAETARGIGKIVRDEFFSVYSAYSIDGTGKARVLILGKVFFAKDNRDCVAHADFPYSREKIRPAQISVRDDNCVSAEIHRSLLF